MSSPNKDSAPDEASRINQGASSSSLEHNSNNQNNLQEKEEDMKRAAAKKLIERYFYQLTDGCGNPNCDNKHCASSGQVKNLTPNQAAAQAIQLFSEDARLCERHPNKMPRTQSASGNILSDANINICNQYVKNCSNTPTNDVTFSSECSSRLNCKLEPKKDDIPYLTEDLLYEIIDECEEKDRYSKLIRTLGEVYSSIGSLAKSFPQTDINSPIDVMLDKAGGDLTKLKKEDMRSLEGEQDKDEDSCIAASSSSSKRKRMPVDLPSVRRAYNALFKLPSTIIESAFVNALVTLAGYLQISLQTMTDDTDTLDDIVHVLLIIFEIPALGSGDFLETALPAVCRATTWLPVEVQEKLARAWAGPGRRSLRTILENLQQLVSLRVIMAHPHMCYPVQDENIITSATKLMKVVYYANMLAGVLESPELRMEESMDDSILGTLGRSHPQNDPLGMALGIHVLDCRKPYLPFSEFYNEPLSEVVEMDKDFGIYKNEPERFCFMNYAFILTPATKTVGLYFDNRIQMYSQRRISFIQSVAGQPTSPYLRLRVRRDHIIDDALVELEMISIENPSDLKKQLVVEFEGEQGIDEGGVSKEFFQLVIEELFNPDYAMFTHQSETQTVWFNPTSFESDAQFTLIGIILGLAIYNNVILAVNFPMVLYRKLMGRKGSFEDLVDWNPTLYNSLKQMLEYEDADFDDIFMQTFRVSYQDVFGSVIFYDLKQNADEINVTQENKREFVDLYADFLLNKSVEKQFRAFYKGFQMVTDESPLELLFRPEEIELLICGSKNFDFDELEGATEYDGGYLSDTSIIKDFWAIVHAFSLEDKRKLLQFATGSDRVPLGGLSKLRLVIARNGPDSDRLPTAHTCFNVLLLPEYSSKEKLKDRLLKAINYSKGFGML